MRQSTASRRKPINRTVIRTLGNSIYADDPTIRSLNTAYKKALKDYKVLDMAQDLQQIIQEEESVPEGLDIREV